MGIVGFAVLAVVCLLILIPLRSISLQNSTEIARLYAECTKERVAERINGTANVIRAYSGIIAQLAVSEVVPKEKKRELLMSEMKALFESEVELKSMWCILEPQALDGMDEQYVKRMGSNSQGVFAPWFIGDRVTALEIINAAGLYEIPKETGLETIADQAWQDEHGKNVQVFSISVPIMFDGTFLGIIAIDYNTEDIKQLIESFSTGMRGKLVTDKGITAVHYNAKRVGKKAEYGNPEIMQKLAEGKQFEGIYPYEGEMQYKVYVPIQLSKVNNPWFYAVDMSPEEIYAGAHKTVTYLVIYFFLGIVLISFASWLVMQPMLKDIVSATGIIRQLSLGRINQSIKETQGMDEIGRMKTELRQLIEGLKHTVDFARDIGKGNLDARYQLLSNDDTLGNSLLEMQSSLQKSEQLKAAFLANMSHEIRTPLNGIVGFLSILTMDSQLPEKIKNYVGIINNSSEQLLNLIDDILDASKLDAGQMTIRTKQFSLDSLMSEMYHIFNNNLKTNGKPHVFLESEIDENVKKCIYTDPVRLRQILQNLLNNAIKYTEKGYIRFGYRLTKNNMLKFFVEDTGIGIPEDHLDVVFQRFRQVELGNNRQYGGTGLGLTISRNLAQLMGGDMYVKSIEGKGSTFTFTIAYHPCGEEENK